MNSFLNAYFSIMLLFMHLLSQTTPAPAIHSPVGGQALQGIVQILGTTSIEGFRSSELSFAYLVNPTDTWFKISESEVQVENGVIADWDTTTISDGDYILRLVIKLGDGNELMSSVDGVRVRNYSPIEAGDSDCNSTETYSQSIRNHNAYINAQQNNNPIQHTGSGCIYSAATQPG